MHLSFKCIFKGTWSLYIFMGSSSTSIHSWGQEKPCLKDQSITWQQEGSDGICNTASVGECGFHTKSHSLECHFHTVLTFWNITFTLYFFVVCLNYKFSGIHVLHYTTHTPQLTGTVTNIFFLKLWIWPLRWHLIRVFRVKVPHKGDTESFDMCG